MNRRRFIVVAGTMTSGLAGCMGGDGTDGGGGDEGGDGADGDGDVDGDGNGSMDGGGSGDDDGAGGGSTDGGATEDGGGSSGGGVVTVTIRNTAFQPDEVRIEPGGTVIWVNEDGYAHTVTSDSDNWRMDVEVPSGGGSTSNDFEEAGVYEVTCSIHPGMDMTVTVGDVSG